MTVQHDVVEGDTKSDEKVVRRILLVDDNAGDRTTVRRFLRPPRQEQDTNRAYELIEVVTGEEGLARCRDNGLDCVLVDFNLPDMNGREFIDALRTSERECAPVPILILTDHEDDESAAEAFRRGVEDYLVKDSLTATGLVRAIENSIARFRVRRELEEQRAAAELRNQQLVELRNQLQTTVAELADATKAKDRFLAVMSHEMRTPLNAILGYAELLEMELDGPLAEGQREQVERIRVGGRHLLDLTNDVLDLTRADALKLELDLRPVDVSAVVEEVASLLEQQAAARGIVLEVECDAELPHVLADLHRLRQVLTNLVNNALKFTDEGSVRVRCMPPGDDGMVKVEVIDTGIGIAGDVLPLVFEEFYQVKDDLTRRHGGSGLGLAISQRLARLMGGDITVASTLGEGSTFTIWLRPAGEGSELRPEDVAQHGARMAARTTSCSTSTPPPGTAAVTVIAYGQDVAALTELARRVNPGVRLVWTTNADDVGKLVVLEQAALVVLDVGSAEGAAWRAAQKLQDLPENQMTAVLLLPSLSEAIPDESSQVLDLGWVSLVPKPFTAEQLTHAISTATGHSSNETSTSSYDVLVVDDDEDSRRVAVRFLAEAGLSPRDVSDGEAALAEMRRQPADVVVLDLMMPVLDGFGVMAAMRADPIMCTIPVVVLTAKSLTDREKQFLSRTAARILQKGAHRLGDVAALVMRAAARTKG